MGGFDHPPTRILIDCQFVELGVLSCDPTALHYHSHSKDLPNYFPNSPTTVCRDGEKEFIMSNFYPLSGTALCKIRQSGSQ